jgi:uncharacterized protein
MSDQEISRMNRRNFIQTGAVVTAATVASASPALAAPEEADKSVKILPKRPLGKTGVSVTILNQGTWKSPSSLDQLLRMGYQRGIRYIDTAHSYGSEPGVAKYFGSKPGLRDEYFLVTKEGIGPGKSPKDLIPALDKRLEELKTDHVDLFFLHAMAGKDRLDWPMSKEFKDTCAAIRKSGKAKFVGFSTHDAYKVQFLENAAKGGFVDAIMVAYTPVFSKDYDGMNKALDACHKAGIGLISMKQLAGNSDDERVRKEVAQRLPQLVEKGLSPYQILLHSIWTDERFASCCTSMRNFDQLRENTTAAQNFEPLKKAEIELLRDALIAAGPTFCANCDGSCSRAAGTEAKLGELARLLTYHDHYGFRSDAKQLYSELPEEARNWIGADLAAASEACHNKLDFAALLAKVERDLA